MKRSCFTNYSLILHKYVHVKREFLFYNILLGTEYQLHIKLNSCKNMRSVQLNTILCLFLTLHSMINICLSYHKVSLNILFSFSLSSSFPQLSKNYCKYADRMTTDISVVKSTWWFFRGPCFNSQYPHDGSLVYSVPSSVLCMNQICLWMQLKQSHIIKMNKIFKGKKI